MTNLERCINKNLSVIQSVEVAVTAAAVGQNAFKINLSDNGNENFINVARIKKMRRNLFSFEQLDSLGVLSTTTEGPDLIVIYHREHVPVDKIKSHCNKNTPRTQSNKGNNRYLS